MQQGRQDAKRGKVGVRNSDDTPVRAGCPIEHPRRNLQPPIQCPTGKAAAEDRCAILLDHFMNVNLPPRPRMPWIKKLALRAGPVGVPSLSCTMPCASGQ